MGLPCYGNKPQFIVGDDGAMTILLGEDKSNKTKLPTEEESRLANSVLAEADFIL